MGDGGEVTWWWRQSQEDGSRRQRGQDGKPSARMAGTFASET